MTPYVENKMSYISNFDFQRFDRWMRPNYYGQPFFFIDNLPDLDTLFSGDNYYAILFKKNPGSSIGHWVMLTKFSETEYEYFDCLGEPPGLEIKALFTHLDYDVHLDYTTKRLMHPDGTLCGKWCMFRALCIPRTLKEFLNFFKGKKNPDSIVDFIINIPVVEE